MMSRVQFGVFAVCFLPSVFCQANSTTIPPYKESNESLLWAGTVITIILAVVFDFTNGFHDTANAVATTIASKSLAPWPAVILSAIFNFLPAFFGLNLVSNTISKTVNIDSLPQVTATFPTGISVTLTALIGAIFWNLLTWKYGIPSSSSHALIGCLVGAGLGIGGIDVITWDSLMTTALAIVISPAVAFILAALCMFCLKHLLKCSKGRIGEDHLVFRVLQIGASCWLSWAHGQNDAQKTMGVMAATLYSAGFLSAPSSSKLDPPLWVIMTAHAAIAAGTMFGGWAIIEAMGMNITLITRASGFAANVGAITSIQGASELGIPVSTTQAAASAVAGSGVGAGRGLNYKTLRHIGLAWIITLPCVIGIGALFVQLARIPEPWGIVAFSLVIAVEFGWGIYLGTIARTAKDVKERLSEGEGEVPPTNAVDSTDKCPLLDVKNDADSHLLKSDSTSHLGNTREYGATSV